MTDGIDYGIARTIGTDEFLNVLATSGLAARRPVDEPDRIEKMLRHATFFTTARDGGKLVGVGRSLTDFAFVCYLSDLAVDRAYQGRGIGRKLLELTRSHAGCRSFLLSAPAARSYYERLGLERLDAAYDFTTRP